MRTNCKSELPPTRPFISCCWYPFSDVRDWENLTIYRHFDRGCKERYDSLVKFVWEDLIASLNRQISLLYPLCISIPRPKTCFGLAQNYF